MRSNSGVPPPTFSTESVLSWLERVETSHEALPRCPESNLKRKLSPQEAQGDQYITEPTKRRQSTRVRNRAIGKTRPPLADVSENIMPSKPLKNPKTPKDRPQKRGRFEEEQVVEEEGEEQEDELDPDPTPRGIRLTAAPRLRRPDTSYEYDQALSGSADSSKRSSSPVKIMEDLQYAEIPTDYQTLDGTVAARCQGFLKHYRELQDLGDRRALIPLSLKPFVESKVHELDRPSPHAYTSPPTEKPTAEAVEYEDSLGREAWQIYQQAQLCEKTGLPESSWNMKVYAPLLELVLRNPKFQNGLRNVDLTSARISPRNLATNHTSRIPLQTKMVDFGICLAPSPNLEDHIRRHLQPLPAAQQSINQTMMGSVRRTPLAVSFEAKVPFTGGQTSDVQLSVWAGAGMSRLRQIVERSTPMPGGPRKGLPVLPALSAHGHHLDLVAFEEQVDRNVMYGKLSLGSSYTLLGVFQMIRGIEILAEWAHTDYRQWFARDALGL